MDSWILTSKYMFELGNIAWQAAQFPELRIYPNIKGDRQWYYDIICTPFPRLSVKEVHVTQLQEELIGVIAALSMAYARKRKNANRAQQMQKYATLRGACNE